MRRFEGWQGNTTSLGGKSLQGTNEYVDRKKGKIFKVPENL